MRQSTISIGTQQKDIRALAGDHFVNVQIKVSKTNVTAKLVNGVLPAGTRIALNGTPAVSSGTPLASNAYGIVFVDVDFNNSKGTEVVPVCIHGFLSKTKIKEYSGTDVTAEEITALNMIKFI